MNTYREPMRVVGYSYLIIIQRFYRNSWHQETLTYSDFVDLLKREFPDYLEEYETTASDKEMFDWFFRYGQTGDPNEDTYVFK